MIDLVKRHAQSFAAAIQFLTRVPVPWQVPFERPVLARSVIYFPAAGWLIGVLLTACADLLRIGVPPLPGAVILLGLWVALSGGLHLDGWMDTADGVFSGRSRERMLDIMKDSRVGAMGVIAAVLLLLFKFAALAELVASPAWRTAVPALIAVPALSRLWMGAAIAGWPSARPNEGLAAYFADAGRRHSAGALIVAAALLLPVFRLTGWPLSDALLFLLAAAATGALVSWLLAGWLCRRLGGLTGDTYGAINEAVEAALLFAIAVLWTQ
ncbi:cobalamin 5'-phosphate synthase [Paenibacillus sp. 32O-W]|uniref:adenosylcobinamide-GDP ribazoletransferase n=1 Tax=Paenibacillus sp. 32O-W TaxID=1695218 RepID=UPI000720C0B7|nr:adenosylcobinamide-GDP ribazoletransferase [Paenibacillus sp. 32O-W]ALS27673.1 cobalamin 5'-phosphate synthase [Paenibacillus sp. 32O-W]